MCMQRADLISKIHYRDPAAFNHEFEVVKMADLPDPALHYKETNDHFIFKTNIEDWLNQFKNV